MVDVVALSGLGDRRRIRGSTSTSGTACRPSRSSSDRLAADLTAADPAGAATCAANATAFKGRVDGLDRRGRRDQGRHTGDEVAITEPVPLYLVRAAGLPRRATPPAFSEAVEEGSDPSAAVLNDTLGLFTGKTVKALLTNAQTESGSTRQVEQAATAAGIPVVAVTETLPAGVDDYVAWQAGQIDQLAAALGHAVA